METAIINVKTIEQKKLLLQLAKVLSIKVDFLTEEDKEDLGLLNAMNKTKTSKRVSKYKIIKELRK